MMARDLSPHQRKEDRDQDDESFDQDDIVNILISYVPIMPFIQVCLKSLIFIRFGVCNIFLSN